MAPGAKAKLGSWRTRPFITNPRTSRVPGRRPWIQVGSGNQRCARGRVQVLRARLSLESGRESFPLSARLHAQTCRALQMGFNGLGRTVDEGGRGYQMMSRRLLATVVLGSMATTTVIACGLARIGGESVAAKIEVREHDLAHCGTCHEEIAARYATTAHAARHILCGQCHGGAEHPEPDDWVADGTCAGCHLSQYAEQLGSNHFTTRVLVDVDEHGFEIRHHLEGPSFFASERRMLHFTGRKGAGGEGGLLCAGCHYDGHRFSLDAVRTEGTCESCHRNRSNHYPSNDGKSKNRCISCHVFQGRTRSGQVINSHSFQVGSDD